MNRLINSFLAVFSVVLMGAIGNAALGQVMNSPTVPEGHPYRYFIPDPVLGWRVQPGVSFAIGDAWNIPEYPLLHSIDINSLGWHDEETPLEKQPGTPRVLMIGDSFVLCMQAPHDQCAQAEIERQTGWQVIPAGVSGWGTDQELAFYETEGRAYNADLVLLMVYMGNDIGNNVWEHDHSRSGWPNFILGKSYQNNPRDIAPPLNLLRFAKYVTLPPPPTLNSIYELFAAQRLPSWENAFTVTEHLLERFQDVTAEDGVSFGVVLIPSSYQLSPEGRPDIGAGWSSHTVTDWLLSVIDVPVLDLTTVLTTEDYIRPGGHLTAAGQQKMGRSVAQWGLTLLSE